MATTMDSSQVGMAAAEEVEMMLVDSANTEDDDGEEIKIDDELDDDMDDDDELTDDDDDDVVSTSGRQTPNSALHHHHQHRYHEPRVQQHHHHHFHYFYQYPSTPTVTNTDSSQQYAGTDSHEIPTTGVTSSMNDAGSAGLVRTISNGSMFGPINANLVPSLLPSGRYPTPSHLISLSANQSINNNSNHHINNNPHANTSGHYYGPVTPTIYENVPVQNTAEQQMNPLVQQLQSQQHLLHQQRQQHNQLLAAQRHNFRQKPSSPEIVNCISAPVSPAVSIGSPQLTTVQSSSSSSSSSSTSGPSSPILSVSTPTSSQTVISNTSSGVPTTSTINNNNHDNNNNNSPNTCVTYHSYPEQASAQASPSRSPSADDSKNQQQPTTFQQQTQQQIQPNSQPPTVQQPPQQQPTPLVSTASPVNSLPTIVLPYTFGRSYQLTSQIEASNLYLCVDTVSQQEFCCKVVNSSKYSKFLGPHMRMDGHEGINQIQKVIFEQHFTFVLFERSFGDLHSYVRNKRRLRENEAQTLFQQILQIVADCHHNGIVLRDLKLRKFIFANEEKTKLKLETLEGASIFEGDNDILTDKHGCPAYVSPEILYSNSYSGMAADCWSMGVILYTMLVGRYPFHDLNPSIVFVKIRRGTYDIPETLSKQARCLIRNLIRLEPEHRLTANDALAHRWFQEKWNVNTKERIIQQHISNLHSFQHQQFLFQHSLSDLTLGPPPRAILTPSLIEGLLQLSDDQVVPTF